MARTNSSTMLLAALVLGLLATVMADTYMHNPRGSNNRLNERSANRNNGNRLFDSQNNNRGGYNKGDVGTQAADQYNEQYDEVFYMSAHNYDKTTGKGASILPIEWTNQHGCGGNEHDDSHKLNCQIILQYMCLPVDGNIDQVRDNTNRECFIPTATNPNCDDPSTNANVNACPRIPYNEEMCEEANFLWLPAQVDDKWNALHDCSDTNGIGTGQRVASDGIAGCTGTWRQINDDEFMPRDGLNTNRQQFTNPSQGETPATRLARKNGDVDDNEGLHEPWEWYDECYRRERNRGLFTADQRLRNNNLGYSSAIFTRQNPNNNRRGYECPEERDYYPYWHPSPWRDIVVMTDRLDLCPVYQAESQNVKPKHLCRNTEECPRCQRFNNERQCRANKGRWQEVGAWNIDAPECIQADWSRVNHNGNGRNGQHNSYNWTLPYIVGKHTVLTTTGEVVEKLATEHRCVLRLRYNISTDDYDAYKVNSSFNQNNGQGIESPVRQNPAVDVGARTTALRLAINTAQFGRTFQDRSHAFRLVPRPTMRETKDRPMHPTVPRDGSEDDFFRDRTLWHLMVRGKRGNIVQTYPSVEYDFAPNHLEIDSETLLSVQWTGSNTHNNGNPAGDGQAGDAGEGTRGTDRHNMVELRRRFFGESFPTPMESQTMWNSLLDAYSPVYTGQDETRDWEEVKHSYALRFASSGYITSYNQPGDPTSQVARATSGNQLNVLLNNAPATFKGAVLRFAPMTANYMCTRNHNFSNRDQKGHLVVRPPAQTVTAPGSGGVGA